MWGPEYEATCLGRSGSACLELCYCGLCNPPNSSETWCLHWRNRTTCLGDGSFTSIHDVPPCHYRFEWTYALAMIALIFSCFLLLLTIACRVWRRGRDTGDWLTLTPHVDSSSSYDSVDGEK